MSQSSYAFFILVVALVCACPAKAQDSARWGELNKAGQAALASGNFGEAERQFRAALEALKGVSENDVRYSDTYGNLANLYISRNQGAKAEPFLTQALKVKEAALGTQDREVIQSISKLAQYYQSGGRKDKAQPLIARLVEYGEREARQLIEISNSFKKLDGYYKSHRRLENAEIQVKQAENETLPEIKAQAIETAVVLDSVGNAIKGDGAAGLAQAEKLFKSSLSLRQRTLTPEHAALSSSLENLGKIYLAQNRSALAEPLLRRSYEVSLKTLGMDRRETQTRLENFAQVLVSLGKLGEARALYIRALTPDPAAKQKGKATFNPSADFLAGFAGLLVKEGRFSEAVTYYARALKQQEAINGPQHASLAALLDSYAYALTRANRADEARRLSARAKSIRG